MNYTYQVKAKNASGEEIKIEITQKTTEIQQSIYIYNSVLRLTEINSTALEYFEKSNFSISKLELEAFAKSKGVFKNQLIESINEACYEFLDDVLIEEEDEHYTINTDWRSTYYRWAFGRNKCCCCCIRRCEEWA